MISQDLIRAARQSDLGQYLFSRGEPVIKKGRYWVHKDYSSLVIQRNMFFWSSQRLAGNSLTFLIKHYGFDFIKSVEELMGEKSQLRPKEEKTEFKVTNNTSDLRRVVAYLHKSRGIDYKIIDLLIKAGLIAQDERGNALFYAVDKEGQKVGGELCGTLTASKFKGVLAGSKFGYGFSLLLGTDVKKACVFESAIDLLSFYQLFKEKLTNHILFSLSGLKENILVHMAKEFKIDLKETLLCVDSDNPGKNFALEMQKKYGCKVFLPTNFKDWNEMLKAKEK